MLHSIPAVFSFGDVVSLLVFDVSPHLVDVAATLTLRDGNENLNFFHGNVVAVGVVDDEVGVFVSLSGDRDVSFFGAASVRIDTVNEKLLTNADFTKSVS